MARYVRHPAIADSRIIGYDTKNVTFKYNRDRITYKVTIDKYQFIHSVIKHNTIIKGYGMFEGIEEEF